MVDKLVVDKVSLQDNKPSRFRIGVLMLIFVTYVIAYADRANIGIVLPYLKKDFGLNNTEAGAIAGMFFMFYALGQIPAAFLIKRFGVRKMMSISLLLTSVVTASHGIVSSIFALKFARVMLGLCESPIASGCITSINNWFPANEKGLASGLFIAAAKSGPVIVPILGATIIMAFSWHYVFFFFAIPGLLLPFVWMLMVPDNPKNSRFVNSGELSVIADRKTADIGLKIQNKSPNTVSQATGPKLIDSIIRSRPVIEITTTKEIFLSWNIWGVSIGYFLFVGTMSVILAWLPTYLTEVKGFSIMETGFITSVPFIGSVIGTTLGGWASDRLLDKRRKPLMMLSCLSMIIMMYALRYAPDDKFYLSILLLVTGLSFSVGFSLFSIFATALCDRVTFPVATAVVNTCGQLGGAALPFITGFILDVYDWNAVFLLLSAGGGLALVALLAIVEPRGYISQ